MGDGAGGAGVVADEGATTSLHVADTDKVDELCVGACSGAGAGTGIKYSNERLEPCNGTGLVSANTIKRIANR